MVWFAIHVDLTRKTEDRFFCDGAHISRINLNLFLFLSFFRIWKKQNIQV